MSKITLRKLKRSFTHFDLVKSGFCIPEHLRKELSYRAAEPQADILVSHIQESLPPPKPKSQKCQIGQRFDSEALPLNICLLRKSLHLLFQQISPENRIKPVRKQIEL